MSTRLLIEASIGVGLVFFVLLSMQQYEQRLQYEETVLLTQTRAAQTLVAAYEQSTQMMQARAATATELASQRDAQQETAIALVQAVRVRDAQATQQANNIRASATQVAQTRIATTQIVAEYQQAARQLSEDSTQTALWAQATINDIQARSTGVVLDYIATSTQVALAIDDLIATSTAALIHADETQVAFGTALVRAYDVTVTSIARENIELSGQITRAANDAQSTQIASRQQAQTTQNALLVTQTQQAAELANVAIVATEFAMTDPLPAPTSPASITTTPMASVDNGQQWTRIANRSVEIYLPQDYINLEDETTGLMTTAEEMGERYRPFIEAMRANPDLFVVYSVRQQLNEDDTVDNVNIINEQPLTAMPLIEFVEETYQTLPENIQVVSQEAITMNGQDVARTILRNQTPDQTVQQVQYIFQGDNAEYWIVTYTTGEVYFEERFPTFEASAQTFRVLDPD